MQELTTTGPTPHEGWWHVEKHSGERFPEKGIRIHDYQLLIKMLKDHRQATGGDLSIGWEGRLQNELCEEHAHYPCKHIAPPIERRVTLNDVKQFLHAGSEWLASGGQFVDTEVAQKRLETCLRCPYNQIVSGCLGCGGIVFYVLEMLNGRHLEKEDELNSCGVCGCYLRAKVWMPLNTINDGYEYPSFCWITKERNENSNPSA